MAFTPISEDQCIGDSLQYINSTFVYLDNSVTTLSANTMGNVKAWASFKADGAVGNQVLNGGYNVESVEKISTGNYQVRFASPLTTSFYAVIGTPSIASGNVIPDSNGVHSNIMMSASVSKNTRYFGIVNMRADQTPVDSPEISVVVIG